MELEYLQTRAALPHAGVFPGPGRVDLSQVTAPVELPCKFEMMEDAKGGLVDTHSDCVFAALMRHL